MADINDLLLTQEIDVGEVNPEAFFSINLPDDGPHTVILRLSSKGFIADRQRDGKRGARIGPAYLGVNTQLVGWEDGQEAGTIAFDMLTTVPMQSGGSRLHAVFALAGFDIPTKGTLADIKTAVEAALAQNPVVVAHTRWEAQINRGSQDSPDYKTIAKGQAAFPKYEGSEKHNPEITDPQTGQTVNAQVRVYKYTRVE